MSVQIHGVDYDRLEDLIAGVTPTFTDWTADPTDAADITDGDISTICTTGNKVAGGGWQYAYFEWDLGAVYNISVTGVGSASVDAGSAHMYIELWNGAAWVLSSSPVSSYSNDLRVLTVSGGGGSKVRLGIASDAAATITPNIREFNVWRLK